MPVQVTYPGVYVEELASGNHTIVGVPTAITAFVGRAPKGPVDEAHTVTSFGDFEKFFGALNFDYPLTYAIKDFFLNGGGQAIIIRRFVPNDSNKNSESPENPPKTPKGPPK